MGDLASSSSVAELARNVHVEEGIQVVETDASKVAAHQEYAEALSLASRKSESAWNRRRCRPQKVLTVAAILVALMLVVGAIYLHLKQKHHLGRLHFHSKNRVVQPEQLEFDGITVITEAGVGECQRGLLSHPRRLLLQGFKFMFEMRAILFLFVSSVD